MLDQSYYDHLPDYGDIPAPPPRPQAIKPSPSWHPTPACTYTLITCADLDQAAYVIYALKQLGRADKWRMRSSWEHTQILLEHPAPIIQMPTQLTLFAEAA